MKIVLSLHEVGQLLTDHLCKTGKLEYDTEIEMSWRIAKNLDDSFIVIEQ